MGQCLCLFPNGKLYRQSVPEHEYHYQWGIPNAPNFSLDERYDALAQPFGHTRVILHRIELCGLPFGFTRAFVPTDMGPEEGWRAVFRALFELAPDEIHPRLHWRDE